MSFIDHIDRSWTLFLDRDGVINKWLPGQYVQHWSMFQFEDQALEALSILANKFDRIIIITNQQGIAKGIMSARDLDNLHDLMLNEIEVNKGRIDSIYYCPEFEGHPNRKPNPGMIEAAKQAYPMIDLSKSIVVGDKQSDMQLARNVYANAVLVADHEPNIRNSLVDAKFKNLFEFARSI